MRAELLWNPALLFERLSIHFQNRRRRSRLNGTVARDLGLGHLDTLELLELSRPLGIQTIYDIGANVGDWILLSKAVFPNARIEAFEPLAVHAERCQARLVGVRDVSLHRIALGARNGTAEMGVTSFSDASSLLAPTPESYTQFGLEVARHEQVLQWRLDDFVANVQIPPPDLIKLDVQGYELEVLRGGVKALAATKAIICEVSFVEIYAGQCAFSEIVHFMSEHGFELYAFGNNTPTGNKLLQADVLFVAKGPRDDGNLVVKLPH